MCSNNGICSRNGAIGGGGIGAGCGDDCRGTLLPVVQTPLVTLHTPAITSPAAVPAQPQQQQLQQQGDVVFEVYVLTNRCTRGGLLHPVAGSSCGYSHGRANSGGTLCTSPTVTLHSPTMTGPLTATLCGGVAGGRASAGCGIQQQEEFTTNAAISLHRGGCGINASLPAPRDAGNSSSGTTTSSSSRKQRASAGAAGSASGDGSGSGQSVSGQIVGVSRSTPIHTIALHPAGCRYAAAAAANATAAAAGGAIPGHTSVHDPVGRNRRAVVRLLVAIVVVFVASWLPYNVVSLRVDLNFDPKYARFLPFALWFGHAHSAVNPIVYWFFNKTFRNCLRNALQNGFRSCRKRRQQRDARASQFV